MKTLENYRDYAFSAEGINFISRIDLDHPIASAIERMPVEEFLQINRLAISELLNLKEYTKAEIEAELERVNEGGSYAFILLGENN